MPVYLCQPGSGANDPWRHGIQVFAAPFAMEDRDPVTSGVTDGATTLSSTASAHNASSTQAAQQNRQDGSSYVDSNHPQRSVVTSAQNRTRSGQPIRRVRHAEVVLVDDVCLAFDRYWLRLRWPGNNGGFAGYIALGKVTQAPWLQQNNDTSAPEEVAVAEAVAFPLNHDIDSRSDVGYVTVDASLQEARVVVVEEVDVDDPTRDDEPQDNASTPSSEPFESTSTLTCLRTGLAFPSSVAMKLLPVYDDGLVPPVSSAPLPSEPVFCRICREGLHDDADEQQPSPAMENETEERNTSRREPSGSPTHSERVEDTDVGLTVLSEPNEARDPTETEASNVLSKGPIQPHPQYQPNPHVADNPLLAPCECSGSMAFVHYLCVEQWRCRSRHPEANQGLHCETCGSAYALPPPSARPANLPTVENEDWLEAMPPHVMAALRQPHIWWQIGAAIVRRRWLRPVAPVLMSPLVALYCRARRLLKKRGVARRRWACSLCRRRARWKCVRCLRSYYCSRQCQNVSWHIVHKHVCYKPVRFWWSVVVYGVVTLLVFPGILRDPLMYDLGLGFIPASFVIMGILGGSVATVLKKSAGLDLRGRTFEMVIILLTIWLVLISWGLVGAFFGDNTRCYGMFGGISASHGISAFVLGVLRKVLLQPAKSWFLMWDNMALHSGTWLRRALCTPHPNDEGCFEHLPNANPDFYLDTIIGGERCAADLLLVVSLWLSAGIAMAGSTLWKRRERQRRAARRPARGEEPRPHQD